MLIYLNPKTVINTLTPLRQIFQDAYLDRILKENPMNYIKNPKQIKPEIDPFSKKEINKILPYLKKEYPNIVLFIAVMIFTGMRIGEVLAMKWENFNFNKWTYKVKENFSRGVLTTPKTTGSIREIPLPNYLKKLIIAHKQYTFLKNDFVFINSYGKPYHKTTSLVKNYWKPSLKELGIRYRDLRQLRHTHAILSLIAGDNPHDIAKRLGHSSLQMLFNRYAKFLKTEIKISKIELFLNEQVSDDENCQHSVSMKKQSF